jgi:hypothetical protein
VNYPVLKMSSTQPLAAPNVVHCPGPRHGRNVGGTRTAVTSGLTVSVWDNARALESRVPESNSLTPCEWGPMLNRHTHKSACSPKIFTRQSDLPRTEEYFDSRPRVKSPRSTNR